MIYIWLDDVRKPPEGHDWIWVKDAKTALQELRLAAIGNDHITISFDHDLGQDENGKDLPSGYDVANHIEKAAHGGLTYNIINWNVHSANPVGYKRITAAMQRFDKVQWKTVHPND